MVNSISSSKIQSPLMKKDNSLLKFQYHSFYKLKQCIQRFNADPIKFIRSRSPELKDKHMRMNINICLKKNCFDRIYKSIIPKSPCNPFSNYSFKNLLKNIEKDMKKAKLYLI